MFQPIIKGSLPKKRIIPLDPIKISLNAKQLAEKTAQDFKMLDNKLTAKIEEKTVETTTLLKETQEEAILAITEAKEKIIEVANNIKDGENGQDGISPEIDEQAIIDKVLEAIPEPEKPDIEEIVKQVIAELPQPKEIDEKKLILKIIKSLPKTKGSLKIITEKIEIDPMSVIEKIMSLPEDKFKIKSTQITGLEQTISAFNNQIGKRGYLHGGGDTIIAGSGITLTSNTNGTKTVSFSGTVEDWKVKLSASDPTAGYLNDKLSAGAGISYNNGVIASTITQYTDAMAVSAVGTPWTGLGYLTSIPTASASVLGGVKIGSRLTMTAGVLSADVQGTSLTLGATTQIPYMNAGGTDFLYSAGLTYDGTYLLSPSIIGSSADNGDITIQGTSSATKISSYVILQPTGGKVGIGTATPNTAFEVNGDISISSNTKGILLGSGRTTSLYSDDSNVLTTNTYLTSAKQHALIITSGGTNFRILAYSGGAGYFQVGVNGGSNAGALYFSGMNGNQAASVNFTSASTNFNSSTPSVYGDARWLAGFTDTSAFGTGKGGGFYLGGSFASNSVGVMGVIQTYKENSTSGDTASQMRFSTRAFPDTLTTKMIITSTGNVLIPNNNAKLLFGTGQGASITYDGTNMVINPQEVGTGNLKLAAGSVNSFVGYQVQGTAGLGTVATPLVIVTAQLTALGTQGSLTFIGGILTASTPAT